jgi:hypothetical protein
MLDSFSQAQKSSVRKTLMKNFRKYITYGEEVNRLLMHQLEQLVLREEQYNKVHSLVTVMKLRDVTSNIGM